MKLELLDTNITNILLMKNTMLIPLVTVTWFFFGWWIYWAFPTGPGIAPSIMNESTALITDESTFSAKWYLANYRIYGGQLR
jgi:ammonia channel protein AmtB